MSASAAAGGRTPRGHTPRGHTPRGRFLTLEGLEGVGKTVNHQFVADWLNARRIPFIETREPGGTPLAEEIRGLLLSPRTESMAPLCELLLVFAARAQHLQEKIEPALRAGTWVLCDRFTDATYAYQGAGRGLEPELIGQLEQLTQRGLQPDRTFLLDAPVEIGLARARARGALDRFEQEQLVFFERARARYLERADADPDRFRVLDATQSLERVQAQIASELEALCP